MMSALISFYLEHFLQQLARKSMSWLQARLGSKFKLITQIRTFLRSVTVKNLCNFPILLDLDLLSFLDGLSLDSSESCGTTHCNTREHRDCDGLRDHKVLSVMDVSVACAKTEEIRLGPVNSVFHTRVASFVKALFCSILIDGSRVTGMITELEEPSSSGLIPSSV
ncbi:hypothetical protein RRG08_019740 [Elysia crispata]|uniref:Uncharacterized protein n=1 Tax=Elysia crispata TaxID=231223 RepID=A0AAE1CTT3_9GAST|nr:hypothetical protein RRG08_019740 [Elysia crispata]